MTQLMPAKTFDDWWVGRVATHDFTVRRIALDQLRDWRFEPESGNLRHRSGRFFTVQGMRVTDPEGQVPEWTQPIINQAEIGLVGILVKRFDGIPHCYLQAKMEPGNVNLLQLSPTVQATFSNFTRVHGGSPVRYLDYFRSPGRGRVLVDTLQSEHGSWFYRKRNRNIVVETVEDVEPHEDFRWIPLSDLGELLNRPNLVNMDSRTVLACLTGAGTGCADREVLSWITDIQARHPMTADLVDLADVPEWERGPDAVSRPDGRHFSVIAVSARSATREVTAWTQPLVFPHGEGVAAFLRRERDGVAEVLVQARAEGGIPGQVELGPTVQCIPASYAGQPRPRYLDLVLSAESPRCDTVHSEEGGRFFHAETRYLVVDAPAALPEPPDHFRWLPVDQVAALLRHPNLVNVQARTLIILLRPPC